MRSIICTYFDSGDLSNVMALGNSIRVFSQIYSMCVVSPTVRIDDRKRLMNYFSAVEVANNPLDFIAEMDQYDRIMILNPNFLMTSKMDFLLLGNNPGGSSKLNVMVINPSRLISQITSFDGVEKMRTFFVDNKYTWRSLNCSYDNPIDPKIRSLMLSNNYLRHPKRVSLRQHLSILLGDILGERGREVVEKEESTYLLAFTHQSVNTVSNYETLEAYGDGFLKGAYMWVLESTPGIITSDQITKMADYYGSREVLAEIAERLDLVRFLDIEGKPDTKTKSDIIESLIGAIAFSWERIYGLGDEAVKMFVKTIYSPYTIDVQGYKKSYTSSVQLVNVRLHELRLNPALLTTNIDRETQNIIYKVLYNGQIVGVGIAPKEKNNIEGSIKMAKNRAYDEVLSKKSLEKFVTK